MKLALTDIKIYYEPRHFSKCRPDSGMEMSIGPNTMSRNKLEPG